MKSNPRFRRFTLKRTFQIRNHKQIFVPETYQAAKKNQPFPIVVLLSPLCVQKTTSVYRIDTQQTKTQQTDETHVFIRFDLLLCCIQKPS